MNIKIMINYVCELWKWNQMKKMILAVMYAIREIAIKPGKNLQTLNRIWTHDFFSGLIAISLIVYITLQGSFSSFGSIFVAQVNYPLPLKNSLHIPPPPAHYITMGVQGVQCRMKLTFVLQISSLQIYKEVHNKVNLCNIANFGPKVASECLEQRVLSQEMVSEF